MLARAKVGEIDALTVEENCFKILEFLYQRQRQLKDDVYTSISDIQKETNLSLVQIDSAARLLESANFIKTISSGAKVESELNSLMVTREGKSEVERRKALQVASLQRSSGGTAIADFAAFFGTIYGSSKIEKVYSSSFSQDEIRNLSKAQKIAKVLTNCDDDSLRARLAKIMELHYKYCKEHIEDLRPIVKRLGFDLTDDTRALKLTKTGKNAKFDYDVALSFAGEDRKYAKQLYEALDAEQIKVFYDEAEKAKLWGKDLYTYLSDLYSNGARFCIVFMSKHYVEQGWTIHERKAAQSRALKEGEKEFILPIRLDETKIPGILDTIGYLDWTEGVEKIVRCVKEKLGKT